MKRLVFILISLLALSTMRCRADAWRDDGRQTGTVSAWLDDGRQSSTIAPATITTGGYDGDTNAIAILSPQITNETNARIGADSSLSNSLALKLSGNDADARFAMLADQRGSSVLWFFAHGQQVGMDMIGVRQAGLFMFGNEYEENSLEMKATAGLDHLHLRHIGVPGGVLSEADVWDDGNAPAKLPSYLWAGAPANSTDAGVEGQVAHDANYFYLYTDGRWIRAPFAAW